jgi:hypothetical protein
MTDEKKLVLVLGGTGSTGKSIVTGLLKRGTFVRDDGLNEPLLR